MRYVSLKMLTQSMLSFFGYVPEQKMEYIFVFFFKSLALCENAHLSVINVVASPFFGQHNVLSENY